MPISTSILDYNLPKELIALYPPKKRGLSRLFVLQREPFLIEHKRYYQLDEYINPNDVVVLNNTKVIKARIFGKIANTGKKVEVLLLNPLPKYDLKSQEWEVLVSPRKRLRENNEIIFDGGYKAIIGQKLSSRTLVARFNAPALEVAHKIGRVPIPPYLRREDEPIDYERYNTVFAKVEGSVAAPTASLNLTKALLKRIQKKANIAYVTLYIGWGTFAPIDTETLEEFKIHSEFAVLPKETVSVINTVKSQKGRVFAVGTTVVRVLEGVYKKFSCLKPYKGEVDVFIYPGFEFKVVDSLLTNFHAPRTSVLALVMAFAGIEKIKKAYQVAISKKYRFLSYGDSMLIL